MQVDHWRKYKPKIGSNKLVFICTVKKLKIGLKNYHLTLARKVVRVPKSVQKKSGLFSCGCMIRIGSFSDPRTKTSETFSLRAKSKKKNKIPFNCQILDQKLPFPNRTTARKKSTFFGQKVNDLSGEGHLWLFGICAGTSYHLKKVVKSWHIFWETLLFQKKLILLLLRSCRF